MYEYILISGGFGMPQLNIVLMQPQIPQNTGNIARTCAATGARLHLIKPMGFTVDDKKLKRAGLDYWYLLDITYYESNEDFFEKNKNGSFFYLTTKGTKAFTDISYPEEDTYIIFGREDAGIDEEILVKNPGTSLRIPMREQARSLNLSNTAAIVAYEVLRQWGYPGLLCEGQLTKYEWSGAEK